MVHDNHTAHSHDHADGAHNHACDHAHGHGHEHDHGRNHEHAPSATPTSESSPDLTKVAILINNWIDHNEGHRRTYLEWRDKLTAAGVPATVAALARIADLTDQATVELRAAAVELRDAQPPRG